jgi:tRNA-dihydrouridine synthase
MIAVHGRTRCQFYTGTADWAAIRAVKDAVSIPVIANGDMVSSADLGRMLALSGADGVMIGRGAYGRPWFPGHLATYAATGRLPEPPSGAALFELVARHYEAMLAHYGARIGLKAARKHLGWYLDGAGAAAGLRHAVFTATTPADTLRLAAAALTDAPERRAA